MVQLLKPPLKPEIHKSLKGKPKGDRPLVDLRSNLLCDIGVGTPLREARRRRSAQLSNERAQKFRAPFLRRLSKRGHPKGLSVLMTPDLMWENEKTLLLMRERLTSLKQGKLKRTYICAIQGDAHLYASSLKFIPGGNMKLRNIVEKPPPCVQRTLNTPLVVRYHLCDLFDFLRWHVESEHMFDAAFLEVAGPLSHDRSSAMFQFWEKSLRGPLILACHPSRWLDNLRRLFEFSGAAEGMVTETHEASRDVMRLLWERPPPREKAN